MNKVILFGNVGRSPEVKRFDSDKMNAKFSLATSKHSKDKDGKKVSVVTWHNIVVWDKLAELCEKWVKKGNSLIVEGEICYREYTDKEGMKRYFTEILGTSLHFAGGKKEEGPVAKDEFQKSGKIDVKSMSDPNELPQGNEDLSNLPF
jgi:single-strand DNA-binding protein